MTVRSAVYGTKEASYVLRPSNEVEVRFGAPATLEVTLAGFDRTTHAGALRLRITPEPGRGGSFTPEDDVVPDSDRAVVGPVEAGDAAVQLFVSVTGHYTYAVAAEKLQLQPGKNTVTLTVPPLFDLTLIADDLDPHTHLVLHRIGGGGPRRGLSWTALGEDRRVLFPKLVAGLYEIETTLTNEAMTIPLEGPTEVRWSPELRNALRVLDAGPLDLRDGDLVLAIGGAEITSQEQGARLLADAVTRDSVTLTIRRGARRIELAVDGTALAQAVLRPAPR